MISSMRVCERNGLYDYANLIFEFEKIPQAYCIRRITTSFHALYDFIYNNYEISLKPFFVPFVP